METLLIHSKEKKEVRILLDKKNNLEIIDDLYRVKSEYILKPCRLDYFNDKIYLVFPELIPFNKMDKSLITQELLRKMPSQLLQGCYDFYHFCGKICVLKDHIFYNSFEHKFCILPYSYTKNDVSAQSMERYVLTQIYNIFIDMNIYLSPEFETNTEINLKRDYDISTTFPVKQFLKLVYCDENELETIPDIFENYQDENVEFVFLVLELFLRCVVEKETFLNKNIKFNIRILGEIANVLLNKGEMKMEFLDLISIIGYDVKTSLFYRYRLDELAQIYLKNISNLNFRDYFRTDYTKNIIFKKNSILNSLYDISFKNFLSNLFIAN